MAESIGRLFPTPAQHRYRIASGPLTRFWQHTNDFGTWRRSPPTNVGIGHQDPDPRDEIAAVAPEVSTCMPSPTSPSRKPHWLVYLVRCRDGSLYTGITNDLPKRLKAHAAGKASRYTRSRLAVGLAYSVPQKSKSAALRREAAIKKMSRIQKKRLTKFRKNAHRIGQCT